MEINIRDDEKTVEIWLTTKEKHDAALNMALGPIYNAFKDRKFLVAVFKSGEAGLFEGTRDLLLHNRTPPYREQFRQ